MANTSTQITKFQDLEVDKTYTVLSVKPIKGKYGNGKSHIMEISDENGEIIKVCITKSNNNYLLFKNGEKDSTKVNFTVRRREVSGEFVGKAYVEIKAIKKHR